MPEEPNNSAEQQPTTPAQPEDLAEATPADAASDEGAQGGGAQPESPAPSDPGGGVPESTGTDESGGVDESAGTDQAAAPTGSGDEPSGAGAVATEQVTAPVDDAAPAEPPADDDTPAAGNVAVSTEEVETAMQEMLAAEQLAGDGTPADAASGGATPSPADDVQGVGQAVPDSAEQESIGSARMPSPASEAPAELPPDAAPFEPEDFASGSRTTDPSQLDLLDDVELDVKVELGRTEMYIEDVLGLGTGSVVKLDKAAGDPVDIFVNERLVARGEVLVLNDNFCVRINDILSPIPELEGER